MAARLRGFTLGRDDRPAGTTRLAALPTFFLARLSSCLGLTRLLDLSRGLGSGTSPSGEGCGGPFATIAMELDSCHCVQVAQSPETVPSGAQAIGICKRTKVLQAKMQAAQRPQLLQLDLSQLTGYSRRVLFRFRLLAEIELSAAEHLLP